MANQGWSVVRKEMLGFEAINKLGRNGSHSTIPLPNDASIVLQSEEKCNAAQST